MLKSIKDCILIGSVTSTCFLFLISFSKADVADFNAAQSLMKKTDCLTCHSADQKLVGPSFKDIAAKYKSSEKVIQSLIEKVKNGGSGNWGNLPMSPHPMLSEQEIKEMVVGILSFQTQTTESKKKEENNSIEQVADADIAKGRDFFQGKLRFQNRGPACNSCHHVKNDAVIGGGILARDLTSVFSRMGAPGVKAILGKPPFPVMERAYRDKPFTEDEIQALVAFLHYADKEHFYQQPRDYGTGLFLSGILGVVLLFIFYSVVGFRRKKRSVNQDIYDRQIKSE